MNKKWIAVTVATLLLIVGVGWAASFLGDRDPKLAELEQMRDERFKQAAEMSDEQRQAQREQFREKIHDLSDDQRRQFFEKSRGQFQQFAMQRMNEFFAKSPEQQRESLDKMIDRMEEHRQGREARGDGPRGGGNPRANRTPQARDQRRKERLDRSTPEMRSMRDTFRDLLNQRRQERGLEPIQGRPRWGHR
jgi:TolA-binding protein